MEPEDGFVTHGAHTADLQPLKQAPTRTGIFSLGVQPGVNCTVTHKKEVFERF